MKKDVKKFLFKKSLIDMKLKFKENKILLDEEFKQKDEERKIKYKEMLERKKQERAAKRPPKLTKEEKSLIAKKTQEKNDDLRYGRKLDIFLNAQNSFNLNK